MIKIQGQYNEAVVYASIVDEATKKQVNRLLDQKFTEGMQIRIMPDCHAGTGCVVGTTMTIKNKVVPNLVGVDIGCGMLCVNLGKIDLDLEKLDNFISENIPAGMNVNEDITETEARIENLRCYDKLKNKTYLKQSIGSLGGGNHFIEVDIANDGTKYLIIHSGSRNLGTQVASIYQEKAIEYHKDLLFNKREEINKVIQEYKEQGRQKEIQTRIKEIEKMEISLDMPEELCYLEGPLFDDYIYDMDISQKFAIENRKEMANRILKYLGLDLSKVDYFETIHNYINMKDMILRKGAISAYEDEMVLIPVNMRDGCILAKGKSNPEYNYSAPHGAGRILSRHTAAKTVPLEEYIKSMEGIYTTSVNQKTLDESPFAYKPLEAILENIGDTVDIIEIIKPIYNFKASE